MSDSKKNDEKKYVIFLIVPIILAGISLAEIFPKNEVKLGLMNEEQAWFVLMFSAVAIFFLMILRIKSVRAKLNRDD